MGTENFEKWCADKHPLIGYLATSFAVNADTVLDAMDVIRAGGLADQLSNVAPPTDWLAMYRDHRGVRDALLAGINVAIGKTRVTPELADGFFALCSMSAQARSSPERQKAFVKQLVRDLGWDDPAVFAAAKKELAEQAQMVHAQHMANIAGAFSGEDAFEGTEDLDKHVKELAFLLLVWLPCLLETGQYPGRLLFRARHVAAPADNKEIDRELAWSSLELLLSIDKHVLQDSRIWPFFVNAQAHGHDAARDIIRGLGKRANRVEVRQRGKVSLASLTWVVARGLGHPLTVPEVRALFNAIAQDKGRGMVDSELPEDDEVLKKGIYRDKEFWQVFHNRDKTGE